MVALRFMLGVTKRCDCVIHWFLLGVLCLGAILPCVAAAAEEENSGDFDDFNRLLVGAVVALPDARVENDLVVLYLRNTRCTNFTVEQVLIESDKNQLSAHDTYETTQVRVQLKGLSAICYLDWQYSFVFVRSGSATLYSFGNDAAVNMDFKRQLLLDSPDTAASVEKCSPRVNINDMDFRGDIAAVVLDTVERLMRNKIEDEAEKRLCKELESLSTTVIADLLKKADRMLGDFFAVNLNPLRAEKELVVPSQIRLIDLQQKSRATGHWMDRILSEVVDFATKPVHNEEKGVSDMNINVLIRDTFLDEDGALVLDADGLEIFNRHDNFLFLRIVVDRVKIFGLDRISKFEPLAEVGKYTVQNKISWTLLTVEMEVSIDIKASSLESSVFVAPPPAENAAYEKIKIKWGFQDVDVLLSILLAVDETKLGALRLGSLLHSDKIVDCILSAIHTVQVSGLALEAADIQPPVMEGFVARGIDRVITDTFDAAFLIYESALLATAPGFFHSIVRETMNDILDDYVRVDVTCFIPMVISASEDGFTDFRDLLLEPAVAREYGATGTEPYGDLPHTLVSEIKQRFLSDDSSEAPRINAVVREALGEASNGTDAVVELGNLLNWNTTVALAGLEAFVGVQVLNASVGNLDSFGSPLHIAEPVLGEANMLNNSISIGIGPRPLRFSARLLITATDYDGLQLHNEVEVQLDIGGARLFVALLLPILENPLFSVPIEDTLNPNCWLATVIPKSEAVNADLLVAQSFSLDQLLLNITCVSCTSPDFSDLIYRLYSPQEIGNATRTVLNLISLARDSDFFRVTTDTILSGASKQCPHNTDFDPNFSYGSLLVESSAEEPSFGKNIRDENVVLFNVANAVLSAVIVLLFYGVKSMAKRRYRSWRDTLPEEALARLCKREEKEREREEVLNKTTQSMFRSHHLPRRVRCVVPLAIVMTIGIQLIGHLAILSKIDIEGQIAGEKFRIREFLVFRFIEACLRSYRNGGSEMAILLFVFTGIYPYLKLVTCLGLWFLPPKRLSVSTRGVCLLWLDVFAKLSMVDIIATLLAVAVFLVYIGGVAERELNRGEFFSTRVIVIPCAGFYGIVIAQRLTRISSSYLLNWHEHIVSSANVGDGSWEKPRSSRLTLSTLAVSQESFKSSSEIGDSPQSSRLSSPRVQRIEPKVDSARNRTRTHSPRPARSNNNSGEEAFDESINADPEDELGTSMVVQSPSVRQLVARVDDREPPSRKGASAPSEKPSRLSVSPTTINQSSLELSRNSNVRRLIANFDKRDEKMTDLPSQNVYEGRAANQSIDGPAESGRSSMVLRRPNLSQIVALEDKSDWKQTQTQNLALPAPATADQTNRLQTPKAEDSPDSTTSPSGLKHRNELLEEQDSETCTNVEPNDQTWLVEESETYLDEGDFQSQLSVPVFSSHQDASGVGAYWRRVAVGMTVLTVLSLAIVGCIMAPSISLDAKTLWGLFESGKTFEEIVSDYSIFRVICSVLVQARFVLDSTRSKIGLGILLCVAMITAAAFPAMRVMTSLRQWYQERKKADVENSSSKDANVSIFGRLKRMPSGIRRALQAMAHAAKRLPSMIHRLREWSRGGAYEDLDGSDMDLLPEYRMKAWRHQEAYVAAFVIAIWQLGSASAYVIHQYCWVLEKSFEMLVFLGLVERTSTQCFPEQASAPSTLLILFSAFFALLASFLFEAVGQYRKVVSLAEKEIQNEITKKDVGVEDI